MRSFFYSNQRAAILVDNSNIFRTALSMGLRVDYSKLLKWLNHRQIVRAILFQPNTNTRGEAGFIMKVRSLGFDVRTKPVKKYPDGTSKADMDVDLTVEAVSLVEKCDVITIVSGDGDFVSLVYYLKSRGVRVEVLGFEHNTSRDLRRAADEFIAITEDMYLTESKFDVVEQPHCSAQVGAVQV